MSKKLFDRNISGKMFKPTFRRPDRQSSAYINKPENTKNRYNLTFALKCLFSKRNITVPAKAFREFERSPVKIIAYKNKKNNNKIEI